MIRAARLCRAFRRRGGSGPLQAINDLSMEVERGECVGLIGRNGSGKTTLLRMLAGTLEPDGGELEIGGSMAALIEAGAGIELDATGSENLENLLILQGVPREELARVLEEAAAFTELGDFLAEPVRSYSSGMVMRLAFAAVIFLGVDLLLVDEVLSVGDPVFQRKCANEIRRFIAGGGTMVLASHNYHEVAALAGRVVLLDQGSVLADGDSDEVFRKFWQRNERDLHRVTSQQRSLEVDSNPLKTHTPLAENTGELRIAAVRFLAADGKEHEAFSALEPLSLEIDFEVSRPVLSPLCRVQFHRSDGLLVMGSNTLRHELDLGEVRDDGTLLLFFPRLPLAEGEYFVSVGLWPDEYRSMLAERAYHFLEHAFVLRVEQARRAGGGLVASEHHWSVLRG